MTSLFTTIFENAEGELARIEAALPLVLPSSLEVWVADRRWRVLSSSLRASGYTMRIFLEPVD